MSKMNILRLAMLGFGDAGRAFANLITEKVQEIEIKYKHTIKVVAITTKSRGSLLNESGIDLSKAIKEIEENGHFDPTGNDFSLISSMEVASEVDYDILLELTPLNIFTGQPAIGHIDTALNRARHVITANKGPLAWAYKELTEKAAEKGVQFLFETTVMDGAPVFNLIEETMPMCEVTEIKGILNSTTNYILCEMEKGRAYEEILEEGKILGFVEANPAMDIEGWDAAAKITVLMNVLMDACLTPDDIERTGIEDINPMAIQRAKSKGKVIKLICMGKIENGKAMGSVKPVEISKEDLYAKVDGTTSILSITTDLLKTITIVEQDPGIEQTAYGPFVDLLKILNRQ
ncbi:MAG TPA: hypothetical protein VFC96_06350 [Anaerovoracaceae bacterium]|nr:hypothetical protein [Anaerovoracaceae bacterium]